VVYDFSVAWELDAGLAAKIEEIISGIKNFPLCGTSTYLSFYFCGAVCEHGARQPCALPLSGPALRTCASNSMLVISI
jgi:hypothetical protein